MSTYDSLERLIRTARRRWGPRALQRGATPPTAHLLPTTYPTLDAALGGGLPCGRISELLGTPTSGATTLALHILAGAGAAPVAYLDCGATFDPEYAAGCGLALETLLLVRPQTTAEALVALQMLVTSGQFLALILDSSTHLRATAASSAALDDALRRLVPTLAALPCAVICLTALSPRPAAALRHAGALPHLATVRLLVERTTWIEAQDRISGCMATVTVLACAGGPAGRAIPLQIHFALPPDCEA